MWTRAPILAVACLLACVLPGCSGQRFDPASRIAYPHTLGESGPLRFVLTREGDQVVVETVCIGGDPFGAVRLTLTSSQGTGTSSAEPPTPRRCRQDEPPVLRATAVRLDQLTPGSRVAVEVLVEDGPAGASTVRRAFIADGANDLYLDDAGDHPTVNR